MKQTFSISEFAQTKWGTRIEEKAITSRPLAPLSQFQIIAFLLEASISNAAFLIIPLNKRNPTKHSSLNYVIMATIL
jgi:hypothetical protein